MKMKILTFAFVSLMALSMLLMRNTAALATNEPPANLEAPQNVTVEVKTYEDGKPYFWVKWTNPQSTIDKVRYWDDHGEAPLGYQIDMKVGNGKWNYEVIGNTIPGNSLHAGDDESEIIAVIGAPYDPINSGELDTIDIKDNVYHFRVRYSYDTSEEYLMSPFSAAVSIGSGAFSANLDTARMSGHSRIETAIAVSQVGWPNSTDTVILTRDDLYPDALTGTPLSKKLDAPILFTNRLTLTPATNTEITRLNPKKVIILGGTVAVSPEIENVLKQKYLIQRIGGYDMYETAKKIAEELGYKGKVVIATGEDFHDALIAAPLAAYKGIPMLLTEKNALPSYTKDALKFIAPSETIVVGNSDMVSDGVISELTNAKRYSGSDYYQTAVVVAEKFGADVSKLFFATGRDFPDALTGSALAAKFNNPILFVNEPIADSVKQFLQKNKSLTKGISLLGGEAVIPSTVVNEIMKSYE